MKENVMKEVIMKDKRAFRMNGFLSLLLFFLIVAGAVFAFVKEAYVLGTILTCICFVPLCGMLVVQPNVSAVVTFFGKYVGCVHNSGFWMVYPFATTKKVSLRVRNFNSEKIKVNDVSGNPIEIAAVVVFKVVDAAKAVFDVDSYEQFVETQSETGLRHVAAKYPYDDYEGQSVSLRGNADEVSRELQREIQERLAVAGVDVIEVRITHLAYATEIASAMLQRQQASAILAARQIIVDGAVGMAQMAINKLEQDGILNLDEERKVSMVNNIMVSIIADRSSQPVVNIGSIY